MRWFKFVFAFALLVSLAVGPVSAQGSLPPGTTQKVIQQGPNNTLIAYGSVKGADKAKITASLFQATQIVPLSMSGDYYYSSNSPKTFFGSSYVQTWYNSTHLRINTSDCGGWCASYTVNGKTTTTWFGCTPQCYSDQIRLSESWYFNGVNVSISIPGGGTFSGGGSTVNFDSGWVNTAGRYYSLSNTYSGVYGKSYVAMLGVGDSASGSHLFGNQYVTANGNGGYGTY